ncbi:MAG TPA: RusA family crossover junction endodeoxyribonuclease [Longimicrobiales bacterium]
MLIHHVTVDPVAKPRMTRRDKWAQRPAVLNYRAYADALRAALPRGVRGGAFHLTFQLAMPRSWTKAKRARMNGTPHKSKPDIDNLVKGVLDALMADDAHVWKVTAEKSWAEAGSVTIRELEAVARHEEAA